MPFTEIEIPAEYTCPLSKEIMIDPVFTTAGYTYDRASIAEWLETHDTDPETGKGLEHKHLTSNRGLKNRIGGFVASNQAQFEQELLIAAQKGNVTTMSRVLKLGISPNTHDDQGWTALHHAANQNHDKLITELLNQGAQLECSTAKFNLQVEESRTVLQQQVVQFEEKRIKLTAELKVLSTRAQLLDELAEYKEANDNLNKTIALVKIQETDFENMFSQLEADVTEKEKAPASIPCYENNLKIWKNSLEDTERRKEEYAKRKGYSDWYGERGYETLYRECEASIPSSRQWIMDKEKELLNLKARVKTLEQLIPNLRNNLLNCMKQTLNLAAAITYEDALIQQRAYFNNCKDNISLFQQSLEQKKHHIIMLLVDIKLLDYTLYVGKKLDLNALSTLIEQDFISLAAIQLKEQELKKQRRQLDLKIEQGKDALLYCEPYHTSQGTPLLLAACNGNIDVLKQLLVRGARLMSQEDPKTTLLHIGARTGNHELLNLGLEYEMKLDATDAKGHSPIAIARALGHLQYAQRLESKISYVSQSEDKASSFSPQTDFFRLSKASLSSSVKLPGQINLLTPAAQSGP